MGKGALGIIMGIIIYETVTHGLIGLRKGRE